jgi:enolase-phosphatase E1
MPPPKAIVTDIEGTTTPIAFVKETLFPFARARLAAFVAGHRNDPAVAAALKAVRDEAGGSLNDAAVMETLIGWIDADRKAAPLKTLQGLIWQAGYASGELKAPVYADAADCLRRWHAAGIALYVYSSGSVPAQKLLFGHSDRGDLTPLFAGWFDLSTGSKLEPESYRKIAGAIGAAPGGILFLSDHPGELDAARAAGLRAVRLDRGDPPPAPPGSHPCVTTFADIVFDPDGKPRQ